MQGSANTVTLRLLSLLSSAHLALGAWPSHPFSLLTLQIFLPALTGWTPRHVALPPLHQLRETLPGTLSVRSMHRSGGRLGSKTEHNLLSASKSFRSTGGERRVKSISTPYQVVDCISRGPSGSRRACCFRSFIRVSVHTHTHARTAS